MRGCNKRKNHAPRITRSSEKFDDAGVFNANVSTHLPVVPRLMLKEAARITDPVLKRTEIARVTRYVIRNFPTYFRDDVRR